MSALQPSPETGLLLLLGAVLILVLSLLLGTKVTTRLRLFEFAVYAAALTVTWTDIRLVDWLRLSHAFLVVAYALLPFVFPVRERLRTLGPFVPALFGLFLIVSGGLLGALATWDNGLSLGPLLNFSVGTAGVLLLFAIWQPSKQQVILLAAIFIASAVVSAFYALLIEAGSSNLLVTGLAGAKGYFAVYCLRVVGPAMAFCWSSSAPKIVAVFVLGLLLISIVASGSRTALIGLLAVSSLFLLTPKRLFIIVGFSVAAALLLLTLSYGAFFDSERNSITRLLSPGDDPTATASIENRSLVLRDGIDTIQSNFFFGVGFDEAVYRGEVDIRDKAFVHYHNVYIQIWTAAGILGMAGFAIIAFVVIRETLNTPIGDLFRVGLFAGASSYFVTGLFQPAIWDASVWIIFGLALSYALAESSSAEATNTGPEVVDDRPLLMSIFQGQRATGESPS